MTPRQQAFLAVLTASACALGCARAGRPLPAHEESTPRTWAGHALASDPSAPSEQLVTSELAALDPASGLCPLDVSGLETDTRIQGSHVLLLARVSNPARLDELRKRASMLTYSMRSIRTAFTDERYGSMPIVVDVSAIPVARGVIIRFEPHDHERVRELAQLIDRERAYLGTNRCAGVRLETPSEPR